MARFVSTGVQSVIPYLVILSATSPSVVQAPCVHSTLVHKWLQVVNNTLQCVMQICEAFLDGPASTRMAVVVGLSMGTMTGTNIDICMGSRNGQHISTGDTPQDKTRPPHHTFALIDC